MNHYRIFLIAVLVFSMALFSVTGTSYALTSSSPEKPPGEPPYGLNVTGDASGTKLKGVIQISFSELECIPGFDGVTQCEDPVYHCPEPPQAAHAKVVLRLSQSNTNKEQNTKTFYADINYTESLLKDDNPYDEDPETPIGVDNKGKVPIWKAAFVQEIVLAQLRSEILAAFAIEDYDQVMYLKEFSLYDQANLTPGQDNAPPICRDLPKCWDPQNPEEEGGFHPEHPDCDICFYCEPEKTCWDKNDPEYNPYGPVCIATGFVEFTAVADITLAVN